MDAPASLWSFIRAFREHWFAALSGGFSVPFTFLATWIDPAWGKVIFAVLAILGAGFAAFRIWQVEREKVIALQTRLRPIIDVFIDLESNGVRSVDTEFPSVDRPQAPPRKGRPSLWLQLMVRSKTDAPLHDCEVRALSIEGTSGNEFKVSEPVLCIWSNAPPDANTKMTIPAGVRQPTNLMWFSDNDSRLFLPLVPVKAGLLDNIQNPNVFKFELAISAREALTVHRTAHISWDGDPKNLKISLD